MALIELFLIVVLGIYLLGYIGRWLFRMWLRKIQKDFIRKAAGGAGGGAYYKQYTWGKNNDRPKRGSKEGEVRVNTGEAPRQRISREVGDYVDFEEVK